MITVSVYKSQGIYKGFHCLGHAGYGKAGRDIVCSAVSVLVINTINSIETFLSEDIEVTVDEQIGKIHLDFQKAPSEKAALLMDSLVLGLTGIEENYSKKFVRLSIKEV
ncbi:MAG: ribosomal-processing cysteine protease Prp [Lachnospiraceae bacterium]|jgi:uncharacterized protein YsxB (DUF464 family)|nr:ribosomal-processing cysteine protease Prp [Lachnospiraceae bacterium]